MSKGGSGPDGIRGMIVVSGRYGITHLSTGRSLWRCDVDDDISTPEQRMQELTRSAEVMSKLAAEIARQRPSV